MKRLIPSASFVSTSKAVALAISAGALASLVACNKAPSTDDGAGTTRTTSGQVEAPAAPAPMNANAPSDPNAAMDFPATNPPSRALTPPAAPPAYGVGGTSPGDTSGAPLGATDEKSTDDSYGGSANGGSSTPATGGGYTSTGADTVRPRANAPAKPGHVRSPTRTTELAR